MIYPVNSYPAFERPVPGSFSCKSNLFNLKSYGSRGLAVSAPELWNKQPDDSRSCGN